MTILHYALGLSPYRSGGLTKYASDLMVAQLEKGHSVALLYPGDIKPGTLKMEIVQDSPYRGVAVYELKNSLPVPLLYGIKYPKDFMNPTHVNEETFISLLDEVRPQIMHVHTLMGLPLQYLKIAKQRNIKIVYTSHDYFGLCLKVNFINNKGNFCENPGGELCTPCNKSVPSTFFLRLRNMKALVGLKKIKYIKQRK